MTDDAPLASLRETILARNYIKEKGKVTKKEKQAVIVYCSPSGSTRHISRVAENKLEEMKIPVSMSDLGKREDMSPIFSQIREAKNNVCLFIGSPVYVSHAVPPVMKFISELPENTGAYAVPFVTWGGASSGIALYEMGTALKAKGFRLLGAAKVLALHSMMWQSESPLGESHPDAQDDKMIEEIVAGVMKKLSEKSPKEIALSDLAYQPKQVHAEMEKVTLELAKAHMPQRKVVEELCSKCGVCGEVCPVGAVSFSPFPEFGGNCILCFSCMRECPENAIKADFSPIEARIRARAEKLSERPFTKIFL